MSDFMKIIREATMESMIKHKIIQEAKPDTRVASPLSENKRSGNNTTVLSPNKRKTVSSNGKLALLEGFLATQKTFILKTEKLSSKAKELMEIAYKGTIDVYNKISVELEASSKENANSISSEYRNLSLARTNALNYIKLQELYLANISDLQSEIATDSLPYMRLAKSFGTFDNWQFDFLGACYSSRGGWAMVVYEPYKNTYSNVFIDGSDYSVPVGCFPVLVINMDPMVYTRDYGVDKKSYVVSMMREINWHVVEARMSVCEDTMMGQIYNIIPMSNFDDGEEKVVNVSDQNPAAMVAEPVSPVPAQNNFNATNKSTTGAY